LAFVVLAGVVSVAVAIAAFFVGVLVVFVAAIVFTVAIVAALAITIGLLVVVVALAAVVVVGPILAFLGAMVFLASAVLALAHRRPRTRSSTPSSTRSSTWRARWPQVRARRPRPEAPRLQRALLPTGVPGGRRVRGAVGDGPPLGSKASRADDALELERASEVEFEHV
jgi:ABC-type multidrug transport system fused ATPase/permease subunit